MLRAATRPSAGFGPKLVVPDRAPADAVIVLLPLQVLQTSHDTVNVDESQKLPGRREGRLHKYRADCALLAGSPLDARELYQKAVEACKEQDDRLWHAAALEGLCCAGLARHEILQVRQLFSTVSLARKANAVLSPPFP